MIDEPDTPNAFVTPGGKVVVFTGLLHLLQMHDDEIAAVLGHEVAHVLARHIVSSLLSPPPACARGSRNSDRIDCPSRVKPRLPHPERPVPHGRFHCAYVTTKASNIVTV